MKKTQSELESRVIVGAHGVAAEEDHLVLGKVIQVGVISLVIFGVGCIWAYRILVNAEHDAQPNGPPPRPAAMGQYEVGIINQRMFEHDVHAEQKIAAQQQALKSGAGEQGAAAHMPIDQAFERVIADSKRPAPAPAPEMAPAPGTPAAPGTPGAPGTAPAPGKAPAPAPGSPSPTPR
ncbi:MAG TPA: hypothetical protein VK539_40290 [Myxococcaceae bacterium]|nr:hypothetical protein [Myxococcaceae bacterium]